MESAWNCDHQAYITRVRHEARLRAGDLAVSDWLGEVQDRIWAVRHGG